MSEKKHLKSTLIMIVLDIVILVFVMINAVSSQPEDKLTNSTEIITTSTEIITTSTSINSDGILQIIFKPGR